MKNLILASVVATLLLPACSGNSSKEHSHDGEIHEHSDTESHDVTTQHHQENFTVNDDSSSSPTDEHEHSHDDNKHQH